MVTELVAASSVVDGRSKGDNVERWTWDDAVDTFPDDTDVVKLGRSGDDSEADKDVAGTRTDVAVSLWLSSEESVANVEREPAERWINKI